MKNLLPLITGIVLVLCLIGGIMYGMRWFSNTTTPITIHKVTPNVTCATMVTSDGVAISCWRDK